MKFEFVEQAKKYLLDKMGTAPEVAIVMGSGLSAIDEILSGPTRIHYVAIPHFPVPKVPGHRGQVVFGKVGKHQVVVFEGRVHYYEGYSMPEVTFCTRVIGRLGAKTLILTNASGAINPDFVRGHLMLITDHINLMGANPLTGPMKTDWGPRFVDQTQVYDPQLTAIQGRRRILRRPHCVKESMCAVAGPTYETPAESRFLRMIGADAVGMSTVPEAIVAKHMGMKVAGLSMLANEAAAVSGKPIDHAEVLDTATEMNADLGTLLQRFFDTYEP